MKKTFILTSAITILTAVPAIASIPSSAFMREQITEQITSAIASKADASALTELDNKIGTLPTGYDNVGAALGAMVSTAATATQTMAGTYTVTGTLNAPTPTLPTAE